MNTIVDVNTFNLLFEKAYNDWEINKALLQHPTIAEVVMWLYEKHNIWITVGLSNIFHRKKFYILIHKEQESITMSNNLHSPYDTPTEGYSEAIKYCLTKLI